MKRPAHLQMKDYLVMLSVVKRGHRLLPQWRVLQSDHNGKRRQYWGSRLAGGRRGNH